MAKKLLRWPVLAVAATWMIAAPMASQAELVGEGEPDIPMRPDSGHAYVSVERDRLDPERVTNREFRTLVRQLLVRWMAHVVAR